MFIIIIIIIIQSTAASSYTCSSETNICNIAFIVNHTSLTCKSGCNNKVKFSCADNSDCTVLVIPNQGFGGKSRIYAENANSLVVNCSGTQSCKKLEILCPTKSNSICKVVGNTPNNLIMYCPLGNEDSCNVGTGTMKYGSWTKNVVESVGKQPSTASCTWIQFEWSINYECKRKCFNNNNCNLVVRYGCMETPNINHYRDESAQYACHLYACTNIANITWVANTQEIPNWDADSPRRLQACSYLLKLNDFTSATTTTSTTTMISVTTTSEPTTTTMQPTTTTTMQTTTIKPTIQPTSTTMQPTTIMQTNNKTNNTTTSTTMQPTTTMQTTTIKPTIQPASTTMQPTTIMQTTTIKQTMQPTIQPNQPQCNQDNNYNADNYNKTNNTTNDNSCSNNNNLTSCSNNNVTSNKCNYYYCNRKAIINNDQHNNYCYYRNANYG